MTGVCVGLKPQSIEDITAIIALYRPGPMESIPRFIACKHDPKLVTYKHPRLEPILSGHLRVHRVPGAGHPDLPGAGGLFAGAGGHGAPGHVQEEGQGRWSGSGRPSSTATPPGASGAVSPTASPEATAQAIYDEIYDFANYAFNKAHAVSYAVVAYQTAYFKCHLHPGVYGRAADQRCWTTATRWRGISASAGTAALRCCRRT